MNQDKRVVVTLDDGRIVLVDVRPEKIVTGSPVVIQTAAGDTVAGRLGGKIVAVWHDETGDEPAPRCGKDGE